MSNTRPFVSLACICERVLREHDNVVSAIRIVDIYTITEVARPIPKNVKIEGMPVQVIDLTVLVSLKAGNIVGPSKGGITIRSPDGKSSQLPTDWAMNFRGAEDGASLVARFAMPLSAVAGLYWFDVM